MVVYDNSRHREFFCDILKKKECFIVFPARSQSIWYKYPKKYQTINDLYYIAKLETIPIAASHFLKNPYLTVSCLITAVVVCSIANEIERKLNCNRYTILKGYMDNSPKSDNDFVDFVPNIEYNLDEYEDLICYKREEIAHYEAKIAEIDKKSRLYKFKHRAEYNFYLTYIDCLYSDISLNEFLQAYSLQLDSIE